MESLDSSLNSYGSIREKCVPERNYSQMIRAKDGNTVGSIASSFFFPTTGFVDIYLSNFTRCKPTDHFGSPAAGAMSQTGITRQTAKAPIHTRLVNSARKLCAREPS